MFINRRPRAIVAVEQKLWGVSFPSHQARAFVRCNAVLALICVVFAVLDIVLQSENGDGGGLVLLPLHLVGVLVFFGAFIGSQHKIEPLMRGAICCNFIQARHNVPLPPPPLTHTHTHNARTHARTVHRTSACALGNNPSKSPPHHTTPPAATLAATRTTAVETYSRVALWHKSASHVIPPTNHTTTTQPSLSLPLSLPPTTQTRVLLPRPFNKSQTAGSHWLRLCVVFDRHSPRR